MKPTSNNSISVPLSHRMKMWRYRVLPVAVWIVALVAALILSSRHSLVINAVGIMEVQEVAVAPLENGRLHGITVDILDPVQEGQVVALMEDTLVRAELMLAETELSKLKTDLVSTRRHWEFSLSSVSGQKSGSPGSGVFKNEENRIELLEQTIRHEMDKLKLFRLEMLYNRQKRLMEDGVIDATVFGEIKNQYERLSEKVANNEKTLAKALQEKKEPEKKKGKSPEADVALEHLVRPIREQISVQKARIEQLKEKRKALVLTAPFSGLVSQVFYSQGGTVLAGTPLLTITSPASHRAVAYIKEDEAREIKQGDAVLVSCQRKAGSVIKARILKVSPKFEEVPERVRRNPALPEWGRAIIVGNFPLGHFHPGESVNIRLL